MRRMFSLKQLQEIANERIEALVEGGTLDNAKPIYCHPLTIYTSLDIIVNEKTYSLLGTALIFNNSDAEINNKAKLVNEAKSFKRLQFNGVFYNKTDGTATELVQLYIEENKIRPVGVALNSGLRIDESISTYDLFEKQFSVIDGLNKIN